MTQIARRIKFYLVLKTILNLQFIICDNVVYMFLQYFLNISYFDHIHTKPKFNSIPLPAKQLS